MNRHRIWQLAADGVLIAAAWLLAFQIRFDSLGSIPPFYEKLVKAFMKRGEPGDTDQALKYLDTSNRMPCIENS